MPFILVVCEGPELRVLSLSAVLVLEITVRVIFDLAGLPHTRSFA
ncbi:hypothetical protein [Paractinoplanes durhamensis]|uniref:Uncharacterized protein n=1 Tax=Paractinoplanes durhamensis TaxID=113563 RepID=A0ABQ3YR79_9ACTN|nr:hypothetical protein [Actinoplanes durhamensis]GIE00095.1 hypothetical protein Adu01nite_14450 [Actinoplanes durhamensis]